MHGDTSLKKTGNLITAIMLIIISILLGIALFRFAFRGVNNDISFSSFLNWLGNVNSMPINVSITQFNIGGDWGVFEFLRNLLNIFTSLFGVIVYMSANLLNVLIFVSQFIRFIFA